MSDIALDILMQSSYSPWEFQPKGRYNLKSLTYLHSKLTHIYRIMAHSDWPSQTPPDVFTLLYKTFRVWTLPYNTIQAMGIGLGLGVSVNKPLSFPNIRDYYIEPLNYIATNENLKQR